MSERFAYGLATPDEGQSYDLDIFSDIGESSWFDNNVSADEVRLRLKNNPNSPIRLRLNTRGGDPFEGIAMYALLSEHKGSVEATVMGLCASAGTIPMLAASKIRMVSAGLVMIHNVYGGVSGSTDEIRAWADVLDTMTERVADLYARHTKKPKADLLAMMAAETYMTAEVAKANGFVHEIIGDAKATPQSSKARAYALAMLKPNTNVPAAALALLAATPEARPGEQLTIILPPAPPIETPPAVPAPAEEQASMSIMKTILAKLGLTEGAEDAVVIQALDRLKANAHAGSEIEKLLGCTGAEAVGAVRGLKDSKSQLETLQTDLGQVKATMSRSSFDAAIAQGKKEKKLTPVAVKDFQDRFGAALEANTDGTAVLQELQGFIKLAAPYGSTISASVTGSGANGGTGAVLPQHDGKTFEQMSGGARAALKQQNPELYELMREDAVARNAI